MSVLFKRIYFPRVAIIILILNLFVAVSTGQEWSEISLSPPETRTRVTDIRDGGFRVTQSISSLNFSEVRTDYGRFTRIEATGYSTADEYGKPLLPVIGKLIEIPRGAEPEVKILSYSEEIIDLGESGFHFPLYPYQPSVPKGTQDHKPEFVYLKKSYLDDSFTQQTIVEIEEIGVMRGRRLGRVIISPVRYNPVKNQVRVISEISIEINFPGSSGITVNEGRFASPLFESSLSSSILNYRESRIKSHTGMVPEKYIILADPVFEDELKEFVKWKTEKGFNVIELYRGRNGVGESQAEMRSALSEIYHSSTPENPAPSYLLIVGDHDQIPAFQSAGHITDLYYAEYDGEGDFFPDLFYGRFSANNIAELRPQIEKTIMYEKYLFPDPAFLSESVFIAGVDSRYAHIHGNGQINYASTNYFNSSNGINSHNWLVPHAPGTPEKIKGLIYGGVSLINYTGHGYEDRWENPRFSKLDVPEMENYGKYPLMIGNGCETNKFNIYECLGEALLRAENKGAVGYIGASNDSFWDEDFYWAVGVGPISPMPSAEETGEGIYDRLFSSGGNPKQSHITQGQIQQAGNLAVTEGTTFERAKYYWEIYHLMGDPSLVIWFSEPPQASVRYPESIIPGTTDMVVSAEPGTYVAFSGNGELIAAGYTNNSGIATLSFDPVGDDGTYKLVATSATSQPYIGEIGSGEVSSAFITLKSFAIRDSLSNNNGIPEAGENTGIDLVLKNSGAYAGENLEVYLQSNNSHVNLHDIRYSIAGIGPGEEISISGVFGLDISRQVPDGESVLLTMVVHVNDTLQTGTDFAIDIAAPGIEIVRVRVADSDGFLMAGQKAFMVFDIHNNGSAAISNAEFHVEESSLQVRFDDKSSSYGMINPGDTISIVYHVFADQEISYGSPLKFEIMTISDGFVSENEVHFIVNAVFDDFEKGDLTYSPWETGTENGWYLTTSDSQAGKYSIRSGNIDHSQKSELSISMDVDNEEYISFLKKLSTERDYDFLEFYIDGQLKGKWSGMINWSHEQFMVEPGLRNFRWVYTKDKTVSMGHDCVWIDQVVFPPGKMINNKVQPPGSYDIVLTRFISPQSGTDLGNSVVVEVEIENRGQMEIIGLEMSYQVNELEPVTEFISQVIGPGTIFTYAFEQTADLSVQGIYRLNVSIAGSDKSKNIFHSLGLDIENFITGTSSTRNNRSL
jgi:hypothetical protein